MTEAATTTPEPAEAAPAGESEKQGDLRALVQEMGRWRRAPVRDTHVIIISIASALPQAKRSPELISQIAAGVNAISAKRSALAFKVSPEDFALMLKAADHTVISVVRDIKVELLRAIERHCVKTFGTVDQTRLVANFELGANYRAAAERVAKYAQLEQRAAEEPVDEKKGLRQLGEVDVRNVMLAYKEYGPERFIKTFIRSQSMVRGAPGKALEPVMSEYFISMDSLRKPLFIDVEMRGSGKMFDEFTLMLDQIMLRAFKRIENGHSPCSINLNVESVFTKAFESFIDEMPRQRLADLTFEFRQPNIVENFDEFQVARGLIQSNGARIAVDRIFPHTVGLVDLEYIGASIAKVHWRAGAGPVLHERKRALQYIRECGVSPVLIRVDETQALDSAADVGITMFQGFLIDDMMKQRAA